MSGEIRALMLGILLFGAIVTGFSMFAFDLATQSGTGFIAQNTSGLSQFGRLGNQTREMEEQVRTARTGSISDLGVATIVGGYNVMKTILTMLSTTLDIIINGVGAYLFLPSWAIAILVMAIGVIVVLAIAGALLKWEI
jgi:hypothetical protein